MHEALLDEPFVGRFVEMLFEFLFERSQATVALAGKLFDGYVAENIFVDRLLEILLYHIYVAEDFAFQAAVFLAEDEVDQFRHFNVFRSLVLREHIFSDVLVYCAEEVAYGIPGRIDNVVLPGATFARVVVLDIELVIHAQVRENVCDLIRRVVEHDLLERLPVFGNVFGVVVADIQVEEFSLVHFVAYIPVVNVFLPADDIADPMPRQGLRLDSVPIRLRILHNHRLLGSVLVVV